MNPQFAGSKRKARLQALEDRKAKALNARLNRIDQLSKLLKNQQELERLLSTIDDPALREETRTLIETFVPWRVQRVELASECPVPLPPSLVH